jgi:hypothetical protein
MAISNAKDKRAGVRISRDPRMIPFAWEPSKFDCRARPVNARPHNCDEL